MQRFVATLVAAGALAACTATHPDEPSRLVPRPPGSLAGALASPSPVGDRPVKSLERSFEYQDGERRVRVWLNPSLLVEFGARGSRNQVPEAPVPGAVFRGANLDVRTWALPGPEPSDEVAARLNAAGVGRFSSAFHTSSTPDSGVLALPGGLVVVLDPAWDEARVRGWAARRGLETPRRLTIGPGWYAVPTAPGLPALLLAETLLSSGGVRTATPDWWRPRSLR